MNRYARPIGKGPPLRTESDDGWCEDVLSQDPLLTSGRDIDCFTEDNLVPGATSGFRTDKEEDHCRGMSHTLS